MPYLHHLDISSQRERTRRIDDSLAVWLLVLLLVEHYGNPKETGKDPIHPRLKRFPVLHSLYMPYDHKPNIAGMQQETLRLTVILPRTKKYQVNLLRCEAHQR